METGSNEMPLQISLRYIVQRTFMDRLSLCMAKTHHLISCIHLIPAIWSTGFSPLMKKN